MKKQVFNPYLPLYEYVPDGEPRVFGDRLYIFGSHDKFDGEAYCWNDYVCYSTPIDDLTEWNFEGYIYHKEQDPINKDGKYKMYAPDVIQGEDGRFYLYYGFDEFVSQVSIAVCDTPAGKYEYYGTVSHPDGVPLGKKKGDAYQFDPGIFIDDDKRIWLYTGFSPKADFINYVTEHFSEIKFIFSGMGSDVVELGNDMKTIISKPKKLIPGWENSRGTSFEGHDFFEASSIRKFDNRYYLIYSTTSNHELAYAVSDYPDHGFVFGGVLHSNMDIGYHGNDVAKAYGGNNHGSLVKIKDSYYIFGHRQTGYTEYSRQGVAEKIERNADGSFNMVEMTSCGLNDGPLVGTGYYSAGIACNLWNRSGAMKIFDLMISKNQNNHPKITQSGIDREKDPDQYIANMSSGSVAGFKYFELKSPREINIEIRGTGEGKMIVQTEEQSRFEFAEIEISPSVDWTSVKAEITTELTGIVPLFFRYEGSGSIDFRGFEIR
ncbi:family 43 glycosylhydrolase [Weissella diestrammenae]|uniref:Family 43 glycosylhydrolase n=1 Tax=Weissella diestrammenae TaxID=1162633 RepID=A0A7G9T5C3_9LACO|nr:family 43 glycosylhydrolase [Weissella diestrammenae]MCM0583156.1 family 43 glycosylhydrolase [Weissella diestrammenae]QNN75298.1 family 43 glycosylhydrolase [Weissella diestrammenae]